ncbi:hypothetical protein [Microvirga sp. M2]|uniref:hypothetical protein n=1 Tax=Microvirga sp. M2 TaxID=3073270 RepID=UPI0039C12956
MAASVGSFIHSAAAMRPPAARVKASHRFARSGVQTPAASRAPFPVANEVTISASTAMAKSITPFHCCWVRTPMNPAGGFAGACSVSGK